MNYLDVVKSFEDAGYTNITVNVDYDIITGWITDEGEVELVTVDGEKKFNSYDEFRLDAEVIITYHDLRKNKNK
ncbi:hypothetical protein [Cytobacillus oceanisediminis]|uniref:hypothetical protein n=1 Tax=Cytobacillus oceanisediminis TaxID=665099 RepID=UPI001C24B24B|nr:hypothetical protein [Cytobacillus oceanisediminis]MBU8769569.1 hypothetical protein [Cytobacillus oceanisediminis]